VEEQQLINVSSYLSEQKASANWQTSILLFYGRWLSLNRKPEIFGDNYKS